MVGTEVGSVPKYFLKSWSVNPSDLRLLRTLLIAATFVEPLFSTAPYSSPVLNWPTTAASLTWPALIAPSTIDVSSRTASIWPAFRAVKASFVLFLNDTATTEIYTLAYTTLFRPRSGHDRIRH